MPDTSLSVTFVGGARSVTGAHFLVESTEGEKTTRIAVDCGLTQGERFCESTNGEPFPYDVAMLDAVFFTHAHADHIGRFPKLVKDGFRGTAYATPPTRDLMPIMLKDSVSIMAREAKSCGDTPPYTQEDMEQAVGLLKSLEYAESVTVGNLTVTFYNAGHILGSALILVETSEKRILFTGDLGRESSLIVANREIPPGPIDALVIESVYGNRLHADSEKSEATLLATIRRVQEKKGTLLIPSFSLERTQIILALIDRFVESGELEPLPVFLDSPLAIQVTELYRKYTQYLNPDMQQRIAAGDDPFEFPLFKMLYSAEDSKEVDDTTPPKVVIAGAGMSHGGRIRSHETHYLPGAQNELLLVGYQVPGSLGRRLQDGARTVTINKRKVKVRAKVSRVGGFSAHADRDGLLSFVEAVNPKEVLVALGEMESASFFAQRVNGFLGIEASIPQSGERFTF